MQRRTISTRLPRHVTVLGYAIGSSRFHTTMSPPDRLSMAVAGGAVEAAFLITPTIDCNQSAVRIVLEGKCVLLAGASGALGLELCQQILRFSPQKLIIVDRYEPYLTERISRLLQALPDACIIPVLCPPSGHESLARAFLDHKPHIVFHNAMRKYLPFFPFQVDSIVQTNYLFTFALARQAAQAACNYFVLISSEAAASRGNLISESLRAAEVSL